MVIRFRPPGACPDRWEDCAQLTIYVCMSRRHYVRSACDLDDLVQDALLLALQRWRKARERCEDCPHLPASIARYAVCDALRGKGYRLRGAKVRGKAFVPTEPTSNLFRSISKY